MVIITLQIQIFILLVIGYILAKRGFMSRETRTQITNMILTIILPCSIVKSFMIKLDPELFMAMVKVVAISLGIQIIYMTFNSLVYRKGDPGKKECLMYGIMVSNAGFMGMPIAYGVFGEIGLLYASLFLLPQRIFMWSSGLSLFAKNVKVTVFRQIMFNPCIVAIYVGFAVMLLTTLGVSLPAPITGVMNLIAQCNSALSMIIIGAILSDVRLFETFDKDGLTYSFYRLLILPLVILVILRLMRVDSLIANLCVLLSAMPAASTTAMLAQKYHGDYIFASKMIFVSTLLSLISLPIITLLYQSL